MRDEGLAKTRLERMRQIKVLNTRCIFPVHLSAQQPQLQV